MPGPGGAGSSRLCRERFQTQEPRQGQRWQVQQETTGAAGALGEDPPPHRGVESGSHPHRVLPSPRRGASPGAALPRPSWDTPPRLASPSGPAHRSAEPPAPAGGTPHLCSVSLALAGRAGGWQQREPPQLSSAGPAPRKGPESRQEGLTWGTAALGRVACTVGTCTSCPQDPLVWMLVVTYKVSLSCPLGKSFTRGRWPFPQPGPP